MQVDETELCLPADGDPDPDPDPDLQLKTRLGSPKSNRPGSLLLD